MNILFHSLKPVFLLLVFLAAGVAFAQPVQKEEVSLGTSGRPLPRFVSLSAGVANMRSGPGDQYPIEWVYKRKLYPLEVIGEYDQWRHVRDADGTEGWMHRILLSGKRTALVVRDKTSLHREASALAPEIARLEAGVIGKILECAPDWCRLDIDGVRGWVVTTTLWGTFQDEIID